MESTSRNGSNTYYQFKGCTGSVISSGKTKEKKYILTAAHCVFGKVEGLRTLLEPESFRYRDFDQASESDDYIFYQKPGALYRKISKVWVHPTYKKKYLDYGVIDSATDIAILELEEAIKRDDVETLALDLKIKRGSIYEASCFGIPGEKIGEDFGFYQSPGEVAVFKAESRMSMTAPISTRQSGGPIVYKHKRKGLLLLGTISGFSVANGSSKSTFGTRSYGSLLTVEIKNHIQRFMNEGSI